MDSELGNLFFVESVCVGWFILEFIIRFASCPSRTKFMSQLMNIIDFVAIIPYFLITGFELVLLIVTFSRILVIEVSANARKALGSHVGTWQPQMVTFIRSARILRNEVYVFDKNCCRHFIIMMRCSLYLYSIYQEKRVTERHDVTEEAISTASAYRITLTPRRRK